MNEGKFRYIGKRIPRKDGIAKVCGREEFASDIKLPNMLYGLVVRSPYASANVVNIDLSGAEKLGAVCINYSDVPNVKYCERIASSPETTYRDRYVLTSTPRHVGEGIAAVAAESIDLAKNAVEAVNMNFEELPAVLDVYKAMENDSAQVHKWVGVGKSEREVKNNISCLREISVGEPDKAFKDADIIIEERFTTGRAYHGQMETKSVVCKPEADGGITVWATAQSIHNVRMLLGEIFSIPYNIINVKKVSTGGTFGSSIHMNTIVPICVALALKSQRPVKMIMSREEDMYDHCKYPSIIDLKVGVDKRGKIVAGDMKVLVDIGAHNTQAYHLLGCMAGWWVSMYKIPCLHFEGKAVYTNKVPACAMQGFGNPQVNFAVESIMDILAEKLSIDPIEFRLMNYVGLGDTFWGQGPTVKSVIESCGVEETFQVGKEFSNWERRGKRKEEKGNLRRGLGVARGFHTSGTGAPQPGEVIDYSSAHIKINEDGSVDLLTALIDPGGGGLDAAVKIVAEELGVPIDKIGLSPADTRSTMYDVATHASRGVYCGGGAIQVAAKRVKTELFKAAARILDASQDAMEICADEEAGQGVICVKGIPEKSISVGEVAKTAQWKGWGTIASIASHRMSSCPPAFTTYFVEVEVNIKTGEIRVVNAVLCCDAGTVINPDLAEGQLHGGFYRGLGFALCEDTMYQEGSGKLVGNGFYTDYKMLTAEEMPSSENVVTYFTKTFEPTGPFGAKGIGEAALNPAPAALANAVYNAIGVRFTDLPFTPEKVLEAINSFKESMKDQTGGILG